MVSTNALLLPLLLLLVTESGATHLAVLDTQSWCAPLGCASGDCTCPSFFTFCDVTTDANGVCTLTQYGIWLIVALVVILVALVLFLFLCLCCCGFCGCCRPGKTVRHVWEPLAPVSSHDVI